MIDQKPDTSGETSLFVNKEYARNLIQIGQMSLPFLHGACLDILAFTGDVGSNAQASLRTAQCRISSISFWLR